MKSQQVVNLQIPVENKQQKTLLLELLKIYPQKIYKIEYAVLVN